MTMSTTSTTMNTSVLTSVQKSVPIASVNGVALHGPGEVLDEPALRQRACTELLRQAAQQAGLLALDDPANTDGDTAPPQATPSSNCWSATAPARTGRGRLPPPLRRPPRPPPPGRPHPAAAYPVRGDTGLSM